MALVGVELETIVSEPDALTKAFRLTLIKKDRKNGEHRKGRVFIEGAELCWLSANHSSAPSINTRPFHGGGRVVSASGSETSVSSSMPTSAIIYDAYTSIIKKKKKKKKKKEKL